MINARNTVKICHASIVKRSAFQKHFSSYRSFSLTRGSGWGGGECKCQLSVKMLAIGHLSVKFSAFYELSVKCLLIINYETYLFIFDPKFS